MTKIIMIAAMAKNGVIGYKNKIPWHLPEDLRHFKSTTLNQVVLMGRKTYESIGQPLPQRQTVVLTRHSSNFKAPIQCAKSLEEALGIFKKAPMIYVAGGAEIYETSLPFAHEICLTKLNVTVIGDTFFPKVDWSKWQALSSISQLAQNGISYEIIRYQRRALSGD